MNKIVAITILFLVALAPLNVLAFGLPADIAMVPSGFSLALLATFFGTPT